MSAAAAAARPVAAPPTADQRPRVLIVLGCTGAGKTALGLSLARAFGAELISVDSIQAYSDLPIASNQCTVLEAEGVRQHCMSVSPPWRGLNVHGFRRAAKALVEEITQRGRNVVLVAGTFYWLEGMLFRTFLNQDEQPRQEEEESSAAAAVTAAEEEAPSPESVECPAAMAEWQQTLQQLPSDGSARARFVRAVLAAYQRASTAPTPGASAAATEAAPAPAPAPSRWSDAHMYALLEQVDPPSAAKLHPNNSRKVLRALEVFGEHARAMSDLVAESGGQRGNGGLVYRAQAIWLDCDQEALGQRLDRRVDDMLQRGLIEEVEKLYRLLWTRQQHTLTPHTDATSNTPWRYACELDPECAICSRVESSDVLPPPLPPPSSSSSAPSSCLLTDNPSSTYLGPSPLQFDWERGVGQALGFKEFRPYFTLKFHTRSQTAADAPEGCASSMGDTPLPATKKQKLSLTESAASSSSASDASATAASAHSAAALFACVATCVASLKARTRSYARVQSRWIKSRLWSAPSSPDAGENNDPANERLSILRLDATRTDAESWAANVEAPAKAVCAAFLAGDRVDLTQYAHLTKGLPSIPVATLPPSSVSSSGSASSGGEVWQKFACSICASTSNGSLEWSRHLASRKHRKNASADARKAAQAAQMAQQEEVRRVRQLKREAQAQTQAQIAQQQADTL